jgi:hypothetical protein
MLEENLIHWTSRESSNNFEANNDRSVAKPDRSSEPFTAERIRIGFLSLAGRQGFEPRYRGPEPRVLPLDDLPVPVATLRKAGTCDYS